ncbi:unnamed protein product [Prunus armeniaca]|uniref:Uncharacterized protein n=1 Tax=Prunus armeniaca TaxID=36596 RepID=A0A6J5WHX1_PRUAR|nr:unnamed protein product [Prunus armeniaca]
MSGPHVVRASAVQEEVHVREVEEAGKKKARRFGKVCAPGVLHREPEIPSIAGRDRGRIRHFTKRKKSLKIKRGSAVERVTWTSVGGLG